MHTKAKLKAATTEHMQALEKSPERVQKFFQDARVNRTLKNPAHAMQMV